MISIQLTLKFKKLVVSQVEDIIPSKYVYLYDIPEDVKRLEKLPFIRINHITSTATQHSSDNINYTRERIQLQYFFDDEDERDIEGMIIETDKFLRENGFYYSTGYDSFDPDLEGCIIVTRQYNYRNKTE